MRGHELRRRRLAAKLNQVEVGNLIGRSRQRIQQLEAGDLELEPELAGILENKLPDIGVPVGWDSISLMNAGSTSTVEITRPNGAKQRVSVPMGSRVVLEPDGRITLGGDE